MFLEMCFQFAAVDMEETSIHITQQEIQIFPYDENELNNNTTKYYGMNFFMSYDYSYKNIRNFISY